MDSKAPLRNEAQPSEAAHSRHGGAASGGAACGDNGIRIIIPSNTEFVRVVRLAVLGVASRMSFTFEDIEDIKLAVSEACNNAILHAKVAANSEAARPTVEIGITPYSDRIEIEVADGGFVPPPGLKPSPPHEPPGADKHELRESGLGLFLMQTLMDKVEHRTSADSHTIVRMVKHLPRPSGPLQGSSLNPAEKTGPSGRA